MRMHCSGRSPLAAFEVITEVVARIPDNLLCEPLAGFGYPTVWKQLTFILSAEEGLVYYLQDKEFDGWEQEGCATITALLATKG